MATVTDVIEHEDGGATYVMELDADEVRFFLEYAIRDLLKKMVKEEKDK